MTADTADALTYCWSNWSNKNKRHYTTIYTPKRAWKYNLQTSSFQAEGENFSITSEELDKHSNGYWRGYSHSTLGEILNRMYIEARAKMMKVPYLSKMETNTMTVVDLQLTPIPPIIDPCNKEQEDRPFTQQEVARAVADLVDFIEEQGVFKIKNLDIENLEEAPISPITE